MNKPRQKKHQAFIDDIKAVEKKHGLRLAVDQPPPTIVIESIPAEEAGSEQR
jgi:hypothetical protein